MAIMVAAVISGIFAMLSALIFADADDFTKANILLGSVSIGIVAHSTYFFNRIINIEVTEKRVLTRAEYINMFRLSAMVWLFPLTAIVIGTGGLILGAGAVFLINLVDAVGILFVFVAGFLATYANRNQIKTSILRATAWSSMFLLLMVIRQVT
jgi:hypothetical protein